MLFRSWRLIASVGCQTNMGVVGVPLQDVGFVSSGDIDDVDEADAFVSLAGIVATLENMEIDQRRGCETEALEDGSPKFIRSVLAAFFG